MRKPSHSQTAPQIVFHLIGSGAVRFNPKRGGTSQLLELGEEKFLVDCGRSAVDSLIQSDIPIEGIGTVFITHLHFDHICDLAHFILLSWVYGRSEPLKFIGPRGLKEFLEKGVRQAFSEDIRSRLGHGKEATGLYWTTVELESAGCCYETDGVTVHALDTSHAGLPNFHYRFDTGGKRIFISSDTEPDQRIATFAKGADLMVMECSGTRAFLDSVPWGHWHLAPEDVAELAAMADAKRVILKHLVMESWSTDPQLSEKMAQTIRSGYKGAVEVGFDGMRITISACSKHLTIP
ncbi:MAG TPA: MBL fold metallo-hydrolase [Chthoniobacteraceae bacterium]|nr:MBL fold metallo-hydrolase [Chthoniobacteraceae bacterium]